MKELWREREITLSSLALYDKAGPRLERVIAQVRTTAAHIDKIATVVFDEPAYLLDGIEGTGSFRDELSMRRIRDLYCLPDHAAVPGQRAISCREATRCVCEAEIPPPARVATSIGFNFEAPFHLSHPPRERSDDS